MEYSEETAFLQFHLDLQLKIVEFVEKLFTYTKELRFAGRMKRNVYKKERLVIKKGVKKGIDWVRIQFLKSDGNPSDAFEGTVFYSKKAPNESKWIFCFMYYSQWLEDLTNAITFEKEHLCF